ncbi:MAG: hypothetical protein OSA84_01425 [Akkermansiaceae bacterium]|nr:hypothetical protein [Akkermansiaceae bacterium]
MEIVNVMYPPGRDSWGKVLEHVADSPTTYQDNGKAEVRGMMDRCLGRNKAALEGVRTRLWCWSPSCPRSRSPGMCVPSLRIWW